MNTACTTDVMNQIIAQKEAAQAFVEGMNMVITGSEKQIAYAKDIVARAVEVIEDHSDKKEYGMFKSMLDGMKNREFEARQIIEAYVLPESRNDMQRIYSTVTKQRRPVAKKYASRIAFFAGE